MIEKFICYGCRKVFDKKNVVMVISESAWGGCHTPYCKKCFKKWDIGEGV